MSLVRAMVCQVLEWQVLEWQVLEWQVLEIVGARDCRCSRLQIPEYRISSGPGTFSNFAHNSRDLVPSSLF
jgi:hypothetical protein